MIRALMLALLLPLVACAPLPAPIKVSDAWTRASIGGVTNAAVFMTITSRNADRLIGASSPAAAKTDLMTMQSQGGGMAMVYIDAIDLPADEPVSLDPSGLHVWLEGVNQPLVAGQTFPLTLRFENAGEQEVSVSVIEATAMAPMSGM